MPAIQPSAIHEKISFRGRCEYDPADKVLYCCWNEGFFSNCTVTLSSVLQLLNNYGTIPERIDFSRGFFPYRDAVQVERKTDLYPEYFRTRPEVPLGVGGSIKLPGYHDSYRYQNFRALAPCLRRFFSLAPPIERIESELISKYDIDLPNTLAVCYRGSDKKTELVLADPLEVLRLAQRRLEANAGLRLWIQTEVQQVSDLFRKQFGSRCFFVEELPMIADDRSPQAMFSEAEGATRRFAFGQSLLAVTHLLAQCGELINHTGNMAYWIWLFRGNSDRMWQFDRRGELVSWRTPIREFWDRSRSYIQYRVVGKSS